MASLFRLLFETMPFSGACDAAGATPDTVGIGSLGDRVQYVEASAIANMRHAAPDYGPEALAQIDPEDRDIWSFTVSANAPTIEDVTCRVRDDEMKEYVVLEKLEYGCADLKHEGAFRQEIDVTTFGRTFHLPLDVSARLACFVTHGCGNQGTAPLWPLVNKQDVGIVQLFVYDLDLLSGESTPLTMLPSGHPDVSERDKFLDACQRLSTPTAEMSPVPGLLYTDDLWHPKDEQIVELIGGGWMVAGGIGKVLLGATTVRVAVVCSLTPCKEREDFIAHRAGGAARLYPHIMVRGTAPLTNVRAGIRFTRPARTTIRGGMKCGCDEMEDEIGAILVADANEDNRQSALPLPYWNNLFNYYVPIEAGSRLLGTSIVGVKHDSRAHRFDNAVIRRGATNAHTVARVRRQGAFDNLHLAPRMRMPAVAKIRKASSLPLDSVDVDEQARETWHLDKVVMAPFCVHDCFHMHWRWLEDSEPGTYGWGTAPCTAPGAPMVPHNQDVRVRVEAPNVATYEAEIFDADAAGWHVVCHHGAGYAVHVGAAMTEARFGVNLDNVSPIPISPSNVWFFGEHGGGILPVSSWAAFYWNLRYYVGSDEDITRATPHERIEIIDLDRLLKVGR